MSGLGETKTLITRPMMSKIAFKFKESILILIVLLTFAKLLKYIFIILQSKSANPHVLYCCVHLEIETLDENIGRWETT